ncbi:sporulation protein YqfD [Bacillus taeanensis]|uniref:Sporulation protein YqfD n=1 Tax=Bacillus taeanensis TaxID=273032 RepID=A0A366XX84_9BACI|nr:sporulation protein YqfD [Bacillus taeanensis]
MKNKWIDSMIGYVEIEVKGKYAELFLNRCIQYRIPIWGIKRVNEETLHASMYIKDIKRVRFHLKKARCKVRFKRKKGIPFFIQHLLRRSGIIIGLLLFFILTFILSNMVWSIDVKGASPKAEHELLQAVNEIGIKRGKFLFLLPSVQDVQQQVTEQLTGVTWVGVKIDGTKYTFDVVEKELPEKEKTLNPRHLVAEKKAIIYDVFVENGQLMVKKNEYVAKGKLLVSGIIGKEESTNIVPAKGVILGEVWYESEVTIPFKTTFITHTGENKVKHYITMGNVKIPVYGFGEVGFKEYEKIKTNYPFYFFKWRLPFGYTKQTYLETENVQRTYSKEEAVQAAKEMAREELIRKIDHDAEIKEEKVLHEKTENGKVKLKMHYTVIENIAVEQPIIQGD